MPDTATEFSAADFGGGEFSADDFAPQPKSVAAPFKGAAAGIEEFAGNLAQGAAAYSEMSHPFIGAPGVSVPQLPPDTRTPGQLMKSIQQNPIYKAGQVAKESVTLSPEELRSKWTTGGRAVGGFAPAALGSLAPVAFGLEAFGNHISNDYEEAKKKGVSNEDAARQAMDRGLASGIIQAAIFEFLPKPLRSAAEKYLINRFGAGTVAKFLAGRVGLGAEGAVIGGTSTGAENVVSGRPVEEGVGTGAGAMGLVSALMPPYMLPKRRAELPPPELPRQPAGLLKAPPIIMGEEAAPVQSMTQIDQTLKAQPAREVAPLKRPAQAAPAIIGEEAPEAPTIIKPGGGEFVDLARKAVQRARIDALQREFEEAMKTGDGPAMKSIQDQILDLNRQVAEDVPRRTFEGGKLEPGEAPTGQFPPESKLTATALPTAREPIPAEEHPLRSVAEIATAKIRAMREAELRRKAAEKEPAPTAFEGVSEDDAHQLSVMAEKEARGIELNQFQKSVKEDVFGRLPDQKKVYDKMVAEHKAGTAAAKPAATAEELLGLQAKSMQSVPKKGRTVTAEPKSMPMTQEIRDQAVGDFNEQWKGQQEFSRDLANVNNGSVHFKRVPRKGGDFDWQATVQIGGKAEKPIKAKYLSDVVDKVHKKWAIKDITLREQDIHNEAKRAQVPEFRQGLADRVRLEMRSLVDELNKSIPKKKPLQAKWKQLQDMAGKLGIQLEDVNDAGELPAEWTPEYAAAVGQLATSLEKAFPKAKGLVSGTAAEKWADDTLKGGGTHGGTDVIAAYAIKGVAVFERGIRDFAKWSAEMIRQFGEGVRPRLKEIYDHALNLEKGASDASGKQETTEVHGDLRTQPGRSEGEVPATQGGGGIQPQAERGIQEEGQAGRNLPLKKPEPGTTRLYQGSGGAEGAGAGGSFFTEDVNRARSYGPNIQYVDVPKDVLEAGRKQARDAGQPSSKDALLPNDWVKKAQKYPHTVAETVHDLEKPLGPSLSESVRSQAIKKFSSMSGQQFLDTIQKGGRPMTGLSYTLGRMARTENLPEMRKARDAAVAEVKKFGDKEGATQQDMEQAMAHGMKAQFFSEAIKFREAIDEAVKTKATTPEDFTRIEQKHGVGMTGDNALKVATHAESGPGLTAQILPEYRDDKLYSGLGALFEPFDKWFEEDLKPFFKKTVDTAKAAMEGTANLMAPVSRADSKSADIMFRSKGEKEKFVAQATGALDHLSKMFHNMSVPDSVDFIDRRKTGRPQANRALQSASDLMGRWYDKVYEAVAKFKPDLPYQDHYMRVLWKVIPGSPEAFKGILDQLPATDRQEFFDRFTTNRQQPTPQLQAIDAKFRQWDLSAKDIEALKQGRGITLSQIRSKKPWRGSQGFTKRHVLDDMSDGLALGGVPVSTNPLEMFGLAIEDAMKFVSANRAWESLKAVGKVEFVRRGQKPPDGFKRIEDTIAKAYFRTPEGLMTSTGEWWVEDGAARLINNYLSRDIIRSSPLGRAGLAIKNISTAVELGLSPFHAVFETNEIMGSRMGLGLAQILSAKRPIEGFQNIAEGLLVEPLTALQEAHFAQPLVRKLGIKPSRRSTVALGEAAIRYAKNADEFRRSDPQTYDWFVKNYPSAKELIDLMFVGGGQITMHQDYRYKAQRSLQEAMKSGNYPGAVMRAVPAFNDFAMKPLFETYIPRLKVGTFLREMSFELERNSDKIASGQMTRDELARKTWSFVEDRFGELNWDNLFWDRTFKSGMQLLFRSVTWKLGNLRGFGKAGRDVIKELGYNWWKEGRAPELTLPMAWFVGMTVVTAMQASIISKVATGKYPWELAKTPQDLMRNLIFPRIDPQDESQRVSIPTYWRDLVHGLHSLPDYVRTSLTGEIGRATDLWNNKDFYGVEVYHPDDPFLKRQYDKIKHLVPLPFGLSSYIAAHQTGATGARSAAGFMGFTKAPFYVSYSPAEKMAYEFIRAQAPVGSRTQSEFQRGVNERIAVDSIKRGDMSLQEAVQQGLVQKQRRDRVRQRVKQTPLQHAVQSIHAEDSVKILSAANEAERRQIGHMVRQKILNSQVLDSKLRHQLLKQVRELMAGQTGTPRSAAQPESVPAP